jgi:DNA polymerase III alpha subunit
MWLKTYYPTEFIYGMLKHEPDMGQIVRFVKEARRLGCEVLAPNVNYSRAEWTLTGDKSISPALSDIKGVGQRAASDIISGQPFTSLGDFLGRINRRVVHRGVLISLAHAGALSDYLPNVRAFVEHAEDILGKKPAAAEARYKELAATTEEYSDDDKFVKQSEVCPLASGKHPLSAYYDVFDAMGSHVQFQNMNEVNYEARIGWFRGVFVELRYNQVGDFHTGEPDDEEKARIGWGKRYANVNVEDESGVQQRIKVDFDIFEDYRWIIDQGTGTCVVMCCVMFPKSQSIRCCFMADLETMRQNLKDGVPWTGAASWFKEHPLEKHGGKKADIRKWAGKMAVKKGQKASGLIGWVLSVKEHLDKNKNTMAFFDLGGIKGCISGLCFASSFDTYKKALKPGNIVKLDLVRSDGSSWFLDDNKACKLEVLAKLSPA